MQRKQLQTLGITYFLLSFTTNVIAIAKLKKTRRRRRRWGVRPINKNRNNDGLYATLIKDMWQYDEEEFFGYTRMTKNQFKCLVQLMSLDLQKNKKKVHIRPEQRLCTDTLHVYFQILIFDKGLFLLLVFWLKDAQCKNLLGTIV